MVMFPLRKIRHAKPIGLPVHTQAERWVRRAVEPLRELSKLERGMCW